MARVARLKLQIVQFIRRALRQRLTRCEYVVYVCLSLYTYTHTHICIYIHISVSIYIDCTPRGPSSPTQAAGRIEEPCNRERVYTYIYMCVCVYTHIFIYTCIYIHTSMSKDSIYLDRLASPLSPTTQINAMNM